MDLDRTDRQTDRNNYELLICAYMYMYMYGDIKHHVYLWFNS